MMSLRKNKSSYTLADCHTPPIKSPSAQEVQNGNISKFEQNQHINTRYEQRFLGQWQEGSYIVTRQYLPTNIKGVNLYMTTATPSKPIATIVMIHGLGDHSGRYMHLADEFAKINYQVILYDQRGFGHSGGLRGDATIEDMHHDLECVLRTIERTYPIFLYCQSLGAALGLSFCLANPTLILQGVIVVNPYIQVASKYSFLKKLLVRLLNHFIPSLMINSYIDYAHCSKNNHNIRNVAEDQFVRPFLTIKMAYNILKLDQYIIPHAGMFKQPILIIHGKEDKVASHMNSVELYRSVGCKDKTLKLFDTGFHEMQNDVEFERLKNLVVNWCYKQVCRDKRISYMRELNYGIKVNGQRWKLLILQLVLIYMALRNQLNKFGGVARRLSILSMMIASLVVHIRW